MTRTAAQARQEAATNSAATSRLWSYDAYLVPARVDYDLATSATGRLRSE